MAYIPPEPDDCPNNLREWQVKILWDFYTQNKLLVNQPDILVLNK